MITAQQALATTKRKNSKKFSEDLNIIVTAIQKELDCDYPKTEIILFQEFSKEVHEKLKDKGYSISTAVTGINKISTKISWEI